MKLLKVLVVVESLALLGAAAWYFAIGLKKSEGYFEFPIEVCERAKISSVQWRCVLEVQNSDLRAAKEILDSDRERTLRNFTAKGLPNEALIIEPAQIQRIDKNDEEWFKLTQGIVIKSNDLARVQKVVDESSELLRFKIHLTPETPKYEIANFTTWLMQKLPKILENSKEAFLESKQFSKPKNFKTHAVELYPVFSTDFQWCDEKGLSYPVLKGDSLGILIKGKVVFDYR